MSLSMRRTSPENAPGDSKRLFPRFSVMPSDVELIRIAAVRFPGKTPGMTLNQW